MSALLSTCTPQGNSPACFFVYTYYDIGTQACPATAPCVAGGCADPFCCRDTPVGTGAPCEQACDATERGLVFNPVRGPDSTICNDELRDRVCAGMEGYVAVCVCQHKCVCASTSVLVLAYTVYICYICHLCLLPSDLALPHVFSGPCGGVCDCG